LAEIEYDLNNRPDWILHIDLPGGQWGDLLVRLPYDRAMLMETAFEREQRAGSPNSGLVTACLKAHFVRGQFIHTLTKQWTGEMGMADAPVVATLANRAYELYFAWRVEAFPKGQGQTDSPTGGQTDTPSPDLASAAPEPSALSSEPAPAS
jgi:hypothetical protein